MKVNFGKDKQKEMDDEKDITFFKKNKTFFQRNVAKFSRDVAEKAYCLNLFSISFFYNGISIFKLNGEPDYEIVRHNIWYCNGLFLQIGNALLSYTESGARVLFEGILVTRWHILYIFFHHQIICYIVNIRSIVGLIIYSINSQIGRAHV